MASLTISLLGVTISSWNIVQMLQEKFDRFKCNKKQVSILLRMILAFTASSMVWTTLTTDVTTALGIQNILTAASFYIINKYFI